MKYLLLKDTPSFIGGAVFVQRGTEDFYIVEDDDYVKDFEEDVAYGVCGAAIRRETEFFKPIYKDNESQTREEEIFKVKFHSLLNDLRYILEDYES